MGPLFIIVPLLILAALFALVLFSFYKIYQYAKRKEAQGGSGKFYVFLKWFFLLPAAGMAAAAAGLVVFVLYSAIDSRRPGFIFEGAFEREVFAGVKELKTEVNSFGDYRDEFMEFVIERESFKQLLPSRLKPVQRKEIDAHMLYDENAPEWWPAGWEETWLYYLRTRRYGDGQPEIKGFAFEREIFVYDPARKKAYYIYSGID